MARHPLAGTLDFLSGVTDTVSEEEVEIYRQTGDFKIRERLIMSHMAIVLGMANRRSRSRASDRETMFLELSSVGFTALTEAVIWAGPHTDETGVTQPSRLTDNCITPYLKAAISRRIYDFIDQDRLVFMPGRTFRHKAAMGQVDPNGDNTRPEIVAVVSVIKLLIDDQDRRNDPKDYSYSVPIAIVEAKRETPDEEMIEAIELAIWTDQERRIVDLRREGYKYREIAEVLGLSVSRIGQIIAPIKERFLKLYA